MEYKILGGSMQVLHINFSKGEKIYADAGKLLSKSEDITMTPRLVGGVVGAIERKFTGASAMLTEFTSDSAGTLAVSGVMPGKVKEIVLGDGEAFIAEHFAFLAAEESVKFTMQSVGIGAAFFGGTGLLLQRFEGPGTVFIHVVGDVIEYDLDGTKSLQVDPGHIAGFSSSLRYSIKLVDNVKTAMFGGVGLFLAKFTGSGSIILHSVSRYKLSSELYLEGQAASKNKK